MSDTQAAHGRCLCGNVGITAAKMSRSVGVCHCGMCRKWSGGPFLAVDCGTEVTFSGEEHVGVFRSSEWAERGFCKICGTSLFYRLMHNGQYEIPVGLFDDARRLALTMQIFTDRKPDYYDFANKTEMMTEAEVFAMFAPPDEP
ncbi:GFA family protein [Leminorella grimontii]|uniref:GFA family protein n=1 Tax=Leminorella grimontii TaxID=82981 RepID=UPI00208BB448|nr:GFA family protein [Leminorella grimontii]GKX59897.1 aldehyde-activating protein [Leminorella grimontii]